MRKVMDFFFKKLRGNEFHLDDRIPSSYLVRMAFERVCMLSRGFFSFIKNDGFLFLGRNTTIKARPMIRAGRSVTIDRNCYIDALSLKGIIIGDGSTIGKSTTVECTGTVREMGVGLTIGKGVGLGTHGFFGCAGGIEIGENTILGNFVSMHSENHVINKPGSLIKNQGVTRQGIVIGENCWIGAKATILDGVVLGNGVVVAAGAVLTAGFYEGDSVYGGIPAKFIRKRLDSET
ncbi:MAG: acyltransferase [Bacteroidales bacterium]